MKVIVKRIWTEPAVAIGLAATVILAILAVVTDASWDASTIAGIAAPFISALGIRQLVTPDQPQPQGSTMESSEIPTTEPGTATPPAPAPPPAPPGTPGTPEAPPTPPGTPVPPEPGTTPPGAPVDPEAPADEPGEPGEPEVAPAS